MQEVRDLATSMKEAMDFIRKFSTDSRTAFAAEVDRAKANVSKIQSMTQQLKDANSEVEAFLGTAGTNFPPAEPTYQKYEGFAELTLQKTDINGVTINPEHTK